MQNVIANAQCNVYSLSSHPKFTQVRALAAVQTPVGELVGLVEDKIFVNNLTHVAHPYRLVMVEYAGFTLCIQSEGDASKVTVEVDGAEWDFNDIAEAVKYIDQL